MISELETKVRKLDDETISIAESAHKVSGQLNGNRRTIRNWLSAKRRGFADYDKYQRHLAERAGAENRWEFTARNQGFESWGEYQGHLLRQRGFADRGEYELYLRLRKENETPEEYFQRMDDESFFWGGLQLAGNGKLENCPAENRDYITQAEQNRKIVTAAMRALNKKERRVIYLRYLKQRPKTLQEIGDETGLSKERIRKIEARALEEMRSYIKRHLYH